MSTTDLLQWVSENTGTLFGASGLGGAFVALAHARRAKVTAEARVQTALADALDAMRGDLEQARQMASEALDRARTCEADREECTRRCDALRDEMNELRRSLGEGGAYRGRV